MSEGQSDASQSISTPKEGNFDIGFKIIESMFQIKVIKREEQVTFVEDQDWIIELILKIAEKKRIEKNKSIFSSKAGISDKKCEQIHEKASLHAEACQFNLTTTQKQLRVPEKDICKCGCGKGRGQPLSFCEDQTKQFFFGSGIVLFFFFLKRTIFLVFFISIIYGVYSLTINILKSDWNFPECQNSFDDLMIFCQYKSLSSGMNKNGHDHLIYVDLWLGFLFCLIWITALRIIRNQGRNLNQKINHSLQSSSDYCVEVNNLPFGEFSESELLKHLLLLWKKSKKNDEKQEPLIIKSVQIIYNMIEPRKKINNIVELALEMTSYLEKKVNKYLIINEFKHQFAQKKAQLIQSLKDLENFREKFIKDSKFRQIYATDTALVEFADSTQQAEFLKRVGDFRTTVFGQIKEYIYKLCFKIERDAKLFKGNQLRIMRAPEPSDIQWRNCEKKFSYYRLLLVWILNLCIVGASFGVLLLIKELRSVFELFHNISLLISLSIQLFNRLIWNIVVKLIELEQANTKTRNIISIMLKSIAAQTINVIVLPIIVNVVLNDNIQGPQGIIGITLEYQSIAFILMIFFNLFNLPYQLKRLSLCIPCIRNSIIRSYSSAASGESDQYAEIKGVLNYYEPPQFPIAGGYVYITIIIYQAIFFCYAQPTLLFFLILNIGCFILVKKYLLLQRCKIPELVDVLIFETCISFMHYIPLMYGCGSILFICVMNQKTDFTFYIPSCLCIILSILSKKNPIKVFNKFNRFLLSLGSDSSQQNQQKIKIEDNNTSQNLFLKQLEKEVLRQSMFLERRECYYKQSNVCILLNYEKKLMQTSFFDCTRKSRQFCERFSVNLNKLESYQIKKMCTSKKTSFESAILINSFPKNIQRQKRQRRLSNFSQQMNE